VSLPARVAGVRGSDSRGSGWRRSTLADVGIGGVNIPAGSNGLLATGSANRDEARFPDGETFDITRANAREHVAFGNGIHFCLGAALARLELRLILAELVRRWPGMRLVEEPIEMVRTLAFRGPLRLNVALNAAKDAGDAAKDAASDAKAEIEKAKEGL